MSAVVHARVVEQLTKVRLRYVAERLDAVLATAARTEPTYLGFLDTVLREEAEAKQRTRVQMVLKIAHFPTVKTLDEFKPGGRDPRPSAPASLPPPRSAADRSSAPMLDRTSP